MFKIYTKLITGNCVSILLVDSLMTTLPHQYTSDSKFGQCNHQNSINNIHFLFSVITIDSSNNFVVYSQQKVITKK